MRPEDVLKRLNQALKAITVPDMGSSILTPQKAQQFIREVSEATPLLNAARRLDMNSHTREIDRVGFAGRILQKAEENVEASETNKPQTYTNTLESKELIAVVGITDNTLEDNIEREDFEDTLLALMGEQAGVDLEELFLNGDTASADGFLNTIDGWMKKAANAISSTDYDPTKIESMFDAMINATPKKYLRNPEQWAFNVTWDMLDDYRDVLRERGTALGDAAQTGAQQLYFKGFPVRYVPNLQGGNAIFAPDQNLVYGMYRTIRIEPDRQPKARRTDFVLTMRVDCHYEDENAATVATGYTGPEA